MWVRIPPAVQAAVAERISTRLLRGYRCRFESCRRYESQSQTKFDFGLTFLRQRNWHRASEAQLSGSTPLGGADPWGNGSPPRFGRGRSRFESWRISDWQSVNTWYHQAVAITPERHREYELARYHARRADAIVRLGGKCALCETTENLELDHIDPAAKSFDIGEFWSIGWDRYLAELTKCQLLCRPHHIEKSRAENQVMKGGLKHNRWRYLKHRCRCDECRADYSVYRRNRYRGRVAPHALVAESGLAVDF